MYRKFNTFFVVFVALALLLFPLVAFAQSSVTSGNEIPLLEVTDSGITPPPGQPWVVARNKVAIDFLALEETSFALDLFDQSVRARIDAVKTVSGKNKNLETTSYTGSLSDPIRSELLGSFSLSVSRNQKGLAKGVHGLFELGNEKFELESRGKSSNFLLSEIDPTAQPSCADSPIAELETDSAESSSADSTVSAEGTATIDVMVVYSVEAKNAAGGESSIISRINNAISLANQGYLNSQVPQQLNLVHVYELPGSESSDFNENLNRITYGSSGWGNVHTLRDQYGADMVAMLTNASQYCGLGWLGPNSGYLYSVTKWSCISGHSFTHELGHNMGSHHDRGNAGSGAVYPYSYGWRFYGTNNAQYRTIMAYSPGSRINYLSNPRINYQGTPTGIENSEDNARSITNTSGTVSGARSGPQECTVRTPSLSASPSTQAGNPGEQRTYSITLSNNDSSCDATTFTLSIAAAPSGWTVSLSKPSLNLTSQDSDLSVLSVTAPVGAASGSYTISVVAADFDGVLPAHGEVSRNVYFTIDNTPPSIPDGLSASVNKKGVVSLNWNASSDNASGVASYEIVRDGVTIASSTSTNYSDSATTLGATYAYAVRAVDNNGNISALSAELSVTIVSTKGGGKPSGGGSGKGGGKGRNK